MKQMMDSNQTPQPTERVGIAERLSNVWNSRSRIARIILLTASGLAIQGCCIVIPLWWEF
jgi:hypothetical protein